MIAVNRLSAEATEAGLRATLGAPCCAVLCCAAVLAVLWHLPIVLNEYRARLHVAWVRPPAAHPACEPVVPSLTLAPQAIPTCIMHVPEPSPLHPTVLPLAGNINMQQGYAQNKGQDPIPVGTVRS